MNIGIIGCDIFKDYHYIDTVVNTIIEYNNIDINDIRILSDGYVYEMGNKHHIVECKRFDAEYEKYGKNAHPINTRKIVEESNMILSFVTKNTNEANTTIVRKSGKPSRQFNICNQQNIFEGFRVDGNVMYFDPNSEDFFKRMGKNKNFTPYETNLGFGKVYSLYSVRDSNNKEIKVADVKSILKGMHNSIVFDYDNYNQFLKRSIMYMSYIIQKHSTDIIMYPKSSRPLVKTLINLLKERLPSSYDFTVYDESLIKTMDKAEIDPETIKVLDPQTIRDIEKKISKPDFKIQTIPPQFRKSLINWVNIDNITGNKIEGKNIVIIDDFLTSGSTIRESMRKLLSYDAKTVTGFTLFKNS